MSTRTFLLLVLAGASANAAPSAQVDVASVARSTSGVTELDGELWGAGPDYEVRFEPTGFAFTAVLARESGAPRPFAFALESVHRGEALVARAAPLNLEHEGRVVSIRHAAAASVSCALVGNAAFEHRLTGAAPLSASWLVVAFDELNVPCGSCTLVPHPLEAFVFSAGLTSAEGRAEVATPLPDAPVLVGLTFVEQWVVDTPASACTWLGAELSNAIEVELQ